MCTKVLQKYFTYIKNSYLGYRNKFVKWAEEYKEIEILLYIIITFLVVLIAVKLGPYAFIIGSYNITEENSITASDSISYFLEALLAVVFGFISFKIKE